MPGADHRVVYNASGQYLAAAHITDPRAVVEHALYWAAVSGRDEARYLTAVLNADVTTLRVRPLQARGQHNPRHFDMYPWWLPIPTYDAQDSLHSRLVDHAARGENLAAALDVSQVPSFQARRRLIRAALVADGLAAALDEDVGALLPTD